MLPNTSSKGRLKKGIPYLILGLFTIFLLMLTFYSYELTPLFPKSPFLRKEEPTYNSNFYIVSKHEELVHELRPNFSQLYDGSEVKLGRVTNIKINYDGFRDKEYSIKKPPNTYRIVALGDSFTFGRGVELNETYPKVLENMLNEGDNIRGYEVLNLGVPGYTTYEQVHFLRIKGLKYNPDAVLFKFDANDMINFTELKKFKKSKNLTDEEAFKGYVRELHGRPFERNWKIINNSLSELNKLTENVTVIILIINSNERQLGELQKISKENGWYTLNINFDFRNKDLIILPPYDYHPTVKGHYMIAKKCFDFITSDVIPT